MLKTIALIAITLISVGTIAALNNQTSRAVLTQTAGDNIQSFAESVAVNLEPAGRTRAGRAGSSGSLQWSR